MTGFVARRVRQGALPDGCFKRAATGAYPLCVRKELRELYDSEEFTSAASILFLIAPFRPAELSRRGRRDKRRCPSRSTAARPERRPKLFCARPTEAFRAS